MGLLQLGDFDLHSGGKSKIKIECDWLTSEDWDAIAFMALKLVADKPFKEVIGIPSGGLKLAQRLKDKVDHNGRWILLVDDVLTTGQSMCTERDKYPHDIVTGVVVFARGSLPYWCNTIFDMPSVLRSM